MRDELGVIWEMLPRNVLIAGLESLMHSLAQTFGTNADEDMVRVLAEPIFRRIGNGSPVLSKMVDLVMSQSGFARTEQLDRLIQDFGRGARTLLQSLWSGENSSLQRLLLRNHVEERVWPHFGLMRELEKSLDNDASLGVKLVLKSLGRDLLWFPYAGEVNFHVTIRKKEVANVPMLAALRTHLGLSPGWWDSDQRMFKLRQIRNFDPYWFEVSFYVGLLVVLFVEQQLLTDAGRIKSKYLCSLISAPGDTVIQTRRFKRVPRSN